MATLAPLPSLSQIASDVQFPTPAGGWDLTSLPTVTDPALTTALGPGTTTVTPTATDQSMLDKVLSFLTTGGPSGSSTTPAAASKSGGLGLEDIIFIVLGLMLVAAGIFSFKSTQTVVETAGKMSAKAAELTA